MEPEAGHRSSGNGLGFLVLQRDAFQPVIKVFHVCLLCDDFFLGFCRGIKVEHLNEIKIGGVKRKVDVYGLGAASQGHSKHKSENERYHLNTI